MSLIDNIDSIAGLKAAETMAQIQMAVAAKILNISRTQGQATVDLITAAAENMEQALPPADQDTNTGLDVYA